eukprot:TRINITY_DN3092_c0_g1_i1.p1 TRINITY_DN3092_c0_g1~~TRINITY_DN3092_c0_g1_i1.p1  ORF type:complete len:277 (-),score=45.87 TRINITY_DN3092_c0_g1_i1:64-894(-)
MMSRFGLVACSLVSTMSAQTLDYDAWDRVVKRHVTPGVLDGTGVNVVDYCGVKSDADFVRFLESLASMKIDGLSKSEVIAVYINAYNAFAFNAVLTGARQAKLNGRCIKTMWPIPDGIPEVFDLQVHNFSGRLVSLNDVESVLRDPSTLRFSEDCRIHGALVCGAVSCPNVRHEAFRPETLDEQLDDQMQEWLAEPHKGCSLDTNGLTVSKIFFSFEKDFVGCSHSVGAFLASHARPEVAAYINAHIGHLNLSFFDYDKALNGDADKLCQCALDVV